MRGGLFADRVHFKFLFPLFQKSTNMRGGTLLGTPRRAGALPHTPVVIPRNFRMMSPHITYPEIHISHSERSVCTCFGSIPAIEITGLLKRKLL